LKSKATVTKTGSASCSTKPYDTISNFSTDQSNSTSASPGKNFSHVSERKVDRLRALALEATCNPFGCKWEWTDQFVEHFRGAEIIILPDHDDPGRAWAAERVRLLTGVAVSVKIVSLGPTEEGADIVDWLDACHTAEELLALVDAPAMPEPTHGAYYEQRVWSTPWIEDVTDPTEITAIRAAIEETDAQAAEPQPSEEPGAKAREEQPHSEKEEPRAQAKPNGPTTIKSTTWVWRDPTEIKPRKWLCAKHYIRGSVTATVGRRGGGKTNRAIIEMLSMLTGRDLLGTGDMPDQKQRVWYIGEDTREEIEMRIVAACAFYGIKPEEIGDRLTFDSIYDFLPGALKLATLQGTKVVLNQAAITAIKADMTANKTDVLILDPLKKFHGLREGDQEMDDLMTILSEIAKETKAAVEFLRHTRKQAAGAAGTPITADDARGADAIIAGPRDVRLVNVQILPCGESVGVLQPWAPPKVFDGITKADAQVAQEVAHGGARWRIQGQHPVAGMVRLCARRAPWLRPAQQQSPQGQAERHDQNLDQKQGLKDRVATGRKTQRQEVHRPRPRRRLPQCLRKSGNRPAGCPSMSVILLHATDDMLRSIPRRPAAAWVAVD
jgi:hypothetical protein